MRLLWNSLSVVSFLGVMTAAAYAQPGDLPREFEQILPRGMIAAITSPKFVPADQAQISGESWVLGVVIDGQARAYSLNLLNSHEVVNDQAGDLAFAAVW